jgi:DNA-binding NarL/FixJ family response regulator
MTEKIYVQINGERIEATGEILEQILKDQSEWETQQLAEQARLASRESALAKLAALGLTQDEIDAL